MFPLVSLRACSSRLRLTPCFLAPEEIQVVFGTREILQMLGEREKAV